MEKYHQLFGIPPWNDIKTELSSGVKFVIPTPQLPNKAQAIHQAREKLRTSSGLTKEIAATLQDIEVLEKVNTPGTSGKIARLKNNIELLQFEADHEHTIILTRIDKVEWETDVQSYKKRVELLQTNRGKALLQPDHGTVRRKARSQDARRPQVRTPCFFSS